MKRNIFKIKDGNKVIGTAKRISCTKNLNWAIFGSFNGDGKQFPYGCYVNKRDGVKKLRELYRTNPHYKNPRWSGTGKLIVKQANRPQEILQKIAEEKAKSRATMENLVKELVDSLS